MLLLLHSDLETWVLSSEQLALLNAGQCVRGVCIRIQERIAVSARNWCSGTHWFQTTNGPPVLTLWFSISLKVMVWSGLWACLVPASQAVFSGVRFWTPGAVIAAWPVMPRPVEQPNRPYGHLTWSNSMLHFHSGLKEMWLNRTCNFLMSKAEHAIASRGPLLYYLSWACQEFEMQNKASCATVKKKEKKTMNPASCNFSQTTSHFHLAMSPYLKGLKQNKHRL